MNLEILKNKKIGLLAIIGPAIALGSIAVSVIVSPWFTWRDNAISDFGVHDVAPLFNSSLIICGIMCAIFALGVILTLKHWLGKIGMLMMFMACISLIGIGTFTENSPPWHFIFSVAFFVLLLLACLVLGIYFMLEKPTRYIGIFALFVAVLGIAGWAYEATIDWGSGVAIPEALTFVPGGLWFMMLGYWHYKN